MYCSVKNTGINVILTGTITIAITFIITVRGPMTITITITIIMFPELCFA